MQFEGIFPVVPTPLNDNESVNLRGLEHLVDHYITSGCQGLVILGSNGEYPYFTLEERLKIIEAASATCGKRAPLIIGCGFMSLRETMHFIHACRPLPLDGLLVALPTYYSLAFDDMLAFFREICRSSPWPVLYYHYPQITGLFFSPAKMAQLLNLENMAGMKESAICIREMKSHIATVQGKGFSLLAGISFLLLETLHMGGSGVICPIAVLTPRLVLDCYHAYKAGEHQKARELQDKILDLIPLMNAPTIPSWLQKRAFKLLAALPRPSRSAGTRSRHAVIKETLRQLGHPISARVRTPLPQITAKEQQMIKAFIERNASLRAAALG